MACALRTNATQVENGTSAFELGLEHLAGRVVRQLVAELHVARDLEPGERLASEILKLLDLDGGTLVEHHHGLDLVSERLVLDPDDRDLSHGLVFDEPVLDLDRVDVLAAPDDE